MIKRSFFHMKAMHPDMKAMPFLDLFTHAIMGGLMFLSLAWSSGILWEDHL